MLVKAIFQLEVCGNQIFTIISSNFHIKDTYFIGLSHFTKEETKSQKEGL